MTQPSSKLLRLFVGLLLGLTVVSAVVATLVAQEESKTVAQDESNTIVTYRARSFIPGSGDRNYIVHVPKNYNSSEKLPLVMVLHGCLEQNGTIERVTNFDALADKERFIVVYPNHKFNPMSGALPYCWEFWEEAHGNHRGQGDVGDLAEIVKEVQKKYNVDPTRIHITGLSSGAAMAVAAMVAYPDVFASGSPTAGVPYNTTKADFTNKQLEPVDQTVTAMKAEMNGRMRPVPIYIIQSKGDNTVKFEYAENIRDSWGKAFGIDTSSPGTPESGTTKGTPWTHQKYVGTDGSSVVETLFLEGLDHGWYGDNAGPWAYPNAPDTAQLVWEFFKAHPGPPAPASTPR